MIPEQAKEEALNFLTRRARSENEVRRRLSQLGWEEEIQENVITWLYHYGYLDDLAYAAAYIRDKLRFHPCGSLKLKQELEEKGISETDVNQALNKNYPIELEVKLARHLFRKQIKRGRSEIQAKRYLYGKGFSGEIIGDI